LNHLSTTDKFASARRMKQWSRFVFRKCLTNKGQWPKRRKTSMQKAQPKYKLLRRKPVCKYL